MIYIIWEFQINSHQTAEFEKAYGSQGTWATLFAKSKNYHGTTLIKDNINIGRYLTIDYWDKLADFDLFIKKFSKDYQKLDDLCEKITSSEKKIGIFEKI